MGFGNQSGNGNGGEGGDGGNVAGALALGGYGGDGGNGFNIQIGNEAEGLSTKAATATAAKAATR